MLKKFRKIMVAVLCATIMSVGFMSAASAANQKQTKYVTGGSITVNAEYLSSGSKRWNYTTFGQLNDYTDCMSVGARTNNVQQSDSHLYLNCTLYKVTYSYQIVNYGSASFDFYN